MNYYNNYQLLEAEEVLRLNLQKLPDDVKTLNLLGIVLNEQGNTNDAIKMLQKAYEISSDLNILENIKIIKQYPGKRWEYIEIK